MLDYTFDIPKVTKWQIPYLYWHNPGLERQYCSIIIFPLGISPFFRILDFHSSQKRTYYPTKTAKSIFISYLCLDILQNKQQLKTNIANDVIPSNI